MKCFPSPHFYPTPLAQAWLGLLRATGARKAVGTGIQPPCWVGWGPVRDLLAPLTMCLLVHLPQGWRRSCLPICFAFP